MTTVKVYVGIGSNIDREKNIKACLSELESKFDNLQVSPVYESAAYGFEGDDFYNLVAGFETELDIEQLTNQLNKLEYQFGRQRNQEKFSPRTLDIDLLLYGELVSKEWDVPRVDIVEYAFVLKPMFDLVPDLEHPQSGKTIRVLWEEFSDKEQRITLAESF